MLRDQERRSGATSLASHYSYLKLSTGSSFAARAAGTVPKRIPTSDETTMATIADSPETGTRYCVRNLIEYGRASPITTPTSPPPTEIRIASDRNWNLISRLVAPNA